MLVGVPGGGHRPSVSPPRSTSSPSTSPGARTPACPAAEASTVRRRHGGSCAAPDRKSACRWVSAAKRMRSPGLSAARPHRPQVPRRVDRQRPAVPEVEQVGGFPSPSSTSATSGRRSVAHRPLRPGRPVLLTAYNYSTELWRIRWVTADQGGAVRAAGPGRQGPGHGKRLELLDLLAQGPTQRCRRRRGRRPGPDHGLGAPADPQAGRTRRHPPRGHQDPLPARRADVAELYTRLRNVAAAHLPDVDAARADYLGDDGIEPIDRDELLRRARPARSSCSTSGPAPSTPPATSPERSSSRSTSSPTGLAELPADAEVVAYCRGPYCVFAHDAVRLLTAHGRRAVRLADGLLDWRLAEHPVEVSAAYSFRQARCADGVQWVGRG